MSSIQEIWHLMDLATAEVTYGAGLAGQTLWYELDGPGHLRQSKETVDNQNQITGTPYSDSGSVIVKHQRVAGPLKYRGILDPLIFWHMALLGGAVTTGAADPWIHTGVWPGLAVLGPPSTAIIQGTDRVATVSYKEFNGIVPQSIEVSIEKGGFLEYTVEVVGDGSMDAAAGETPPVPGAALAGNQLCWENIVHVKMGPAAEVLGALFRKLRYKLSANLIRLDSPASGKLAATWQYDQKVGITLELDLTVSGERGDTIWNYWNDPVATGDLQFDFLIQKSASRSFNILGNKFEVIGDSMDDSQVDEAGLSLLTFGFKTHYVTADLSPFKVIGMNDFPALLA